MVGDRLAAALGPAELQCRTGFENSLTSQNQPLGSSAPYPETTQFADSVLGCVGGLGTLWTQCKEPLKRLTESSGPEWSVPTLIAQSQCWDFDLRLGTHMHCVVAHL